MSYTIPLIQLEIFTKFHAAVAELQVDLALCKTNALVFVHVHASMRVCVRCSRRLTHVLCCAPRSLTRTLSCTRCAHEMCAHSAAVVYFHSQLCSQLSLSLAAQAVRITAANRLAFVRQAA